MYRVILLTCLLLIGLRASAAEFTVDAQAGADTNAGTPAAPFQTLAHAIETAKAGDVINLMPGDYADYSFRGGVDKHLFQDSYVTIRPAPGVDQPQEKVSIGRIELGARAGQWNGEERKGVFDIYLRFEGVRLRDGVYNYGGRHMQIIKCRIERLPPWVGSVEAIEKFAVELGAGTDFLVEDCEITNTAGGLVLNCWNGIIRNNVIHDITHDGIRSVSARDGLIEGNDIYNLDDGVDDDDERGKGWNRHCDAIHIFIPGPGVPGTQNKNVVVRGNRMWNCESQAMQFNNYLRVKDVWNEDITIENNIFGPTRANTVNIADPVDGIIVRNNTFISFEGGRSFQGLDRIIECLNNTLRINPICKRAEVYNNILCNAPPASPGWFVGFNVLVNPSPNDFPTRTDIVVPELAFVDREAMDGVLPPDSPAINAGTRLAPAGVLETDIKGTPRDIRPDAGAWELAGQSPAAEPAFPEFVGPAKLYRDDFLDGNTAADPWLSGQGELGIGWAAPEGQKAWGISLVKDPEGNEAIFTASGIKGPSWMISENGADWRNLVVRERIRNAYNDVGAGVLLRGNIATEGYLVDLAKGRIVARKLKGDGTIAEKELATNGENYLPRTMYRTFVYAVQDTPAGVKITLDADGDGTVDLEALDPDRYFPTGQVGLYSDSKNGSHRTDVNSVQVEMQ